jgi:hypothetical protein
LNGHDEIPRCLGFQDVTVRTSVANLALKPLGFVHREYQNSRRYAEFAHTLSGHEAAGAWHGDIKDHDIGFQVLYSYQSVIRVCSLSAHFPIRPGLFQKGADARSHNFVIVYNQNLRSHNEYLSGCFFGQVGLWNGNCGRNSRSRIA